jgi:hypothetical protein
VKKFAFRLGRVLYWRHTQLRIEEAELRRLQAEVRALDAELEAVSREREAARRDLLAAGNVSGQELAAMNLFREHSLARSAQLAGRRAAAREAAARQMEKVTGRRRQARLLERLKERHFRDWIAASEREAEQQAAENHLIRWNQSK